MILRTLFTLLFSITMISEPSHAAILWVGGEDIDFPYGTAPCTQGLYFRAGYARYSLLACSIGYNSMSKPFDGGPVTSVWFSARLRYYGAFASTRLFGLGKTGTNNGIWVGSGSASTKLALFKYDGTTLTTLASETGNTLTNQLLKIDVQVINFGASATVNVYMEGSSTPTITYSGDVTVGGITNLDDFRISGNSNMGISELIVADTDTRTMSLVTLAPNAVGASNTWTSAAYTSISESYYDDTTVNTSASSGQVFQCNLTDLPSGSFDVAAVKIAARATKSSAGPTALSLGVYTTSSYQPAATTLQGGWETVDKLFSINPVSTSSWTSSDINSLQMSFQTAP